MGAHMVNDQVGGSETAIRASPRNSPRGLAGLIEGTGRPPQWRRIFQMCPTPIGDPFWRMLSKDVPEDPLQERSGLHCFKAGRLTCSISSELDAHLIATHETRP